MPELPINLIKRLPNEKLTKLLDNMRDFLKKDKHVIEMFKEYEVPIEEIDFVPMKFEDIDVSAKTSKGVIIFSYALLEDADFIKDYSYGVHELVHYLQQTTGTKPTKGSDDDSYLDNKNEQEGFQHQIRYIDKMFGEEEAENYTDDLLEYHNKSEEEKKKLKDKLMSKIK